MPRRKCRNTGSAPLTSSVRAKCLHGGKGVIAVPCRSGLQEPPAVCELQGRCLPGVKWELAVNFDVSPKCPYVMTLARSNYLLGGLGYMVFLCSLPHQKGEYNNTLMEVELPSTEGNGWNLVPFEENILRIVWKSMNLQVSQTDTQIQHSSAGTLLRSYWVKTTFQITRQ